MGFSFTTVVQKGSEHRSTGSVKKESERRSISDRYPTIVQHVVQQQVSTLAKALDNAYCICLLKFLNNYWMPLSLSFCLLTDPVFQTFLYHCIVVWPMMMEAFDIMFSGKSVYVSRRLVSIEPVNDSIESLLVCELIHNAQ